MARIDAWTVKSAVYTEVFEVNNILWNIFEIAVNASEIFMVFFLLVRKLGVLPHKRFLAVIGSVMLVCCTVTMNKLSFSSSVTPIISAVLFIIYAFVCFSGGISQKILWSCLPSIIFVADNFIVCLILGFVTRNLQDIMIKYSFARVEAMLLYVLLNLVVFTAIYSVSKVKRRMPTLHKFLMITLIIVNVAAMSVLINTSVLLAQNNLPFIWCSITCGLILLCSFGQVVLFFSTSIVYNKYIDSETQLKTLEAEKKHAEKMAEIYSEIRKWRHDYSNQMTALSTIAADNGCIAVSDYIERMTGVCAQLVIINTGNPIIDAVLSDKIQTAENHGIHIEYSIAIPNGLTDKGYELSSILSNLFDNAIEALQNADTVKKEIAFEMVQKENALCIRIKNPTNGKYNIVNNKILTTKTGDNHGYGLKIIKSMVKKCDGSIDIEPEASFFAVNIIIPCGGKND